MDNYVSSGTFWFTVAMINAGLAEQKNRSRWNWFLLSILLGPIATAIIVIRPAHDPVLPPAGPHGAGKTYSSRNPQA